MRGDAAPRTRVRANDWTVLTPPAVGEWTPELSVSIVIPAFRAGRTLPFTLAALAAQTYPADLLEVVVVDDEGTLELPPDRPDRTRVVRTLRSWGRAHACAVGAEAAHGDVVHWLDSDMLPFAEHVEAQLRWHHVVDHAVVLGHKLFVDPPLEDLSPADVGRVVAQGRADALFADEPATTHDWVEAVYDRTEDLATAGASAYTVHVGATASVRRDLYLESGGMDSSLKLGEDIELGWRLAQAGAVFVPERGARSWHLGPTHVMRRREEVNRYNAPFLTDRIAQLRWRRRAPGRTYTVPYVDVVVDTTGHSVEEVQASVDSVLAGSLSDLRCTLVGPWSALDDARRRPLDDPLGDLRMVHAGYAGETRVRFVEHAPEDVFPVPFLLKLPVGWTLGRTALAGILKDTEQRGLGLRRMLLADGGVATLTRTAARRRAARVARPGEDLVDVIDEVCGSWWASGEADGFRHVLDA